MGGWVVDIWVSPGLAVSFKSCERKLKRVRQAYEVLGRKKEEGGLVRGVVFLAFLVWKRFDDQMIRLWFV